MHRPWLRIVTGVGGAVLAVVSALLGYAELGHALQGNGGAWVAFVVVLLTGVLGLSLVHRAWRGARAPDVGASA